ncbi:MAG: NUDIX domain-containing protein [Pseudomonadota bacterium]
MIKLKNLFYKLASLGYRALQAVFGFKTLGPRAIILNSEKQILLVKHTYQPHWYLPGGGVKKGESVKAALHRELLEEIGLTIKGEPQLFGIYHNTNMGGDDYAVIYIVKDFSMVEAYSPEIEQQGWFHYDDLPAMVSPATQRRLREYFSNSPVLEHW